jgi:hypothetical protein
MKVVMTTLNDRPVRNRRFAIWLFAMNSYAPELWSLAPEFWLQTPEFWWGTPKSSSFAYIFARAPRVCPFKNPQVPVNELFNKLTN